MAPKKKNEPKPRERPAAPRADARVSRSPGLEKVRELVTIMEAAGLSELSYEDQDLAVGLKRAVASGFAPMVPMAPAPLNVVHHTAPTAAPTGGSAAAAPAAEGTKHHVVHSPFVGTFYRSPSPNEAAFVEVGQRVKKGQTLCIVEAMKLMNEIESDAEGVVVRVLVENAQPVQYGDALFEIDTAAR